jgi:hypothetical protein
LLGDFREAVGGYCAACDQRQYSIVEAADFRELGTELLEMGVFQSANVEVEFEVAVEEMECTKCFETGEEQEEVEEDALVIFADEFKQVAAVPGVVAKTKQCLPDVEQSPGESDQQEEKEKEGGDVPD